MEVRTRTAGWPTSRHAPDRHGKVQDQRGNSIALSIRKICSSNQSWRDFRLSLNPSELRVVSLNWWRPFLTSPSPDLRICRNGCVQTKGSNVIHRQLGEGRSRSEEAPTR